ncbi:MAG: hypothetical protein M1818_003543 [Claussenomyces sp. TS43310]|nr:MAG: hypothetical protein M1818_003543 [Claussenomyces sp. TS43310]
MKLRYPSALRWQRLAKAAANDISMDNALNSGLPAVIKLSNRCFSTSPRRSDASPSPFESKQLLPSRWLSDLKQRIGKCITFGLNPGQIGKAGQILDTVAKDWKELSAGSEGFLTGVGRAGLVNQRVVWGEMDCMGHVNNVTYVRYAESARVEWIQNYAVFMDPAHKREWSELTTPKGTGLILRSIRTDYKFVSWIYSVYPPSLGPRIPQANAFSFFSPFKPMTWPDHISVYHKLRHRPTQDSHSFILDVIIMSERMQRPAARCEEDIVVYDYQRGAKTALPPFVARHFTETFRLQEEAKERNTHRVLALLNQVEALEKESWNRSDAKEDLGSALV